MVDVLSIKYGAISGNVGPFESSKQHQIHVVAVVTTTTRSRAVFGIVFFFFCFVLFCFFFLGGGCFFAFLIFFWYKDRCHRSQSNLTTIQKIIIKSVITYVICVNMGNS